MIKQHQMIEEGWIIQNVLDVNGIAIVYKEDLTALAIREEEDSWNITVLQETIN